MGVNISTLKSYERSVSFLRELALCAVAGIVNQLASMGLAQACLTSLMCSI